MRLQVELNGLGHGLSPNTSATGEIGLPAVMAQVFGCQCAGGCLWRGGER